MKFDIVIVTYNSKKWMENCINSIENQKDFDLKNLSLYIVDNGSSDGTTEYIEKRGKETTLSKIELLKTGQNLGFGKGNNYGFEKGNSEYVFFLNPDTELVENTMVELENAIKNSEQDFAVWECRQKPYEHPKMYNILTGETSWASGACIIVKREVFAKIGGFDSKIFMYAEDVDISWNIRLHGYKIKYVPKAVVVHYCYKNAGEIKPVQYYNSIINNLNLRRKYGSFRQRLAWYKHFYKVITRKGPFKGSRINLVKQCIKNFKYMSHFTKWRNKPDNKKYFSDFKPNFVYFDYEFVRQGDFEPIETKLEEEPLVSIIVRTCGRPNVLRECLISLRNQTYKNLEVIVVEDGENKSENMIKEEFSDLNVIYKATIKKQGRCLVGNLGMQLANGKYLNFLDDDDLFFADHVETLVQSLLKHPKYKLAYTTSFESKIEVKSREPKYEYIEESRVLVHNRPFSRVRLLTMNLFPIQAVMFEKTIFEKYGGLDEELDNLEDWEMWQRFSTENAFLYVPKTTSLYRVPAKAENYKERQEELDSYYKKAKEKVDSRKITIEPQELLEEIKNM
ncbi:MAG: glycosyltransferase [Clostridia bacterium]|nr:glycosyltransferase [Clostridia bacterium]